MCEFNSNKIQIGDRAPTFIANTTFGEINLEDYNGKWVILFSHPGDYTPVCTTEFIAFAKMYNEFQTRNCELIGLSIDSTPSHLAWVYNIYKNTNIEIPFPIISDIDMKIAKMYGMISPNVSNTKTVRSVFFIDPNQIVRAIFEYPMTNGRNIGEIIRLLDGMQLTDLEKVSTPANWLPNMPVVMPSPKNYNELKEKLNNKNNLYCMDWFLCFDKPNETSNSNFGG